MPLYDYVCSACGRRFEVAHGVHVEGPTVCPICGRGPIRKAISAAAVHYKGSGWAKKERRATATPGTSRPSAEGSASDGGAKAEDSGSGSASDSGSEASTAKAEAKSVESDSAGKSDAKGKAGSANKADPASKVD
jgi:putative FmdB family regulatory protein